MWISRFFQDSLISKGHPVQLRKYRLNAWTFVAALAAVAQPQDVVCSQEPIHKQQIGAEAKQSDSHNDSTSWLEAIRKENSLPALWACRIENGEIDSLATGTLSSAGIDSASATNLIHLGSCTKAMTAVLIAQLVSSEKLTWETTLAEIFGEETELSESAWAGVTVRQLLRHRSGAPANCLWPLADMNHQGEPVAARRYVLRWLAARKYPANRQYVYSNVGYALLGHIVETIEGKDWESLMRQRLFAPLAIRHAGFGPVRQTTSVGDNGQPTTLNQPWGHRVRTPFDSLGDGLSALFGTKPKSKYMPIRFDNPAPLGPAGRAHMPIGEWAKFVKLFTSTKAPKELNIKQKVWEELLDAGGEGDYASGWVHMKRKWAGGDVLFHNGSNTTWYCVAWVSQSRGTAYLAATNCFGDAATAACDAAVQKLGEKDTPIK